MSESRTQLNACQGLNSCKGQGFEGSGTQVGDCSCASAVEHTCAGGNQCAHQGGCGYAATGATTNWIPGQNSAKGNGGCGAPIPDQQTFLAKHKAPATIEFEGQTVKIEGRNVWEVARQLLGINHTLSSLPEPKPTTRRNIKPTT